MTWDIPFESKESSRKVDSEVDQIPAGVSFRESQIPQTQI